MLSREKKEISLKSSALPVIRRDITQTSIPKIQIQRGSQKNSIGLDDLYADD